MNDELPKLLFEERGYACFEKIYSLHKRFKNLFPAATAKRALVFLSHFSESFLLERSNLLISRLLITFCKQVKQIEETESPHAHIFTRFLNSQHLLRVVVSVANLEKQHYLTKDQILEGVRYLLPGVQDNESSYQCFSNQEISFHYLEIKKMRGSFFSKEEKEKIKLLFGEVLKKKIRHAFKPIVLPGIEEDVFKYVKQLANELTHVEDIPQIMIFFSEFLEDQLIYLVIVLRIKTETGIPFASFEKQSTSSIRICLEKQFVADFLGQEKYPKEAAVFKLSLTTSACTQENKVNLRTARQIIVKILEDAFGEVRDFNGGMILKEKERLSEIKEACKHDKIPTVYLEELFFEIRPHYMRALIATQTCGHLVRCLNKMISKPLPDGAEYCSEAFVFGSTEIVIVKTCKNGWLTQISQTLVSSGIQMGYSFFYREGMEYLCLFEQAVRSEGSLLRAVEKRIVEIDAHHASNSKSILRLNLQGGDPTSLNPRLASDIHCHTLCTLLFEGLTCIDHTGNPVPALAETIEISPSGLKYVFHLRSSAWSNGEEVSAYDFERTWKKALMESVPSFLCPRLFFYLKNARNVRKGILPLENLGVYAKDAKTLHVELETPCRHFLHLAATPLFFPLYGDAEEPKYFNGPFYLEKWNHGEEILLSRNPFCWNSSQLKIKGIRFHMENDPDEIYKKFLNFELDIIGDPISPLPSKFLNLNSVRDQLVTKKISRIFWIHCNIRAYPLTNKWVRQALNLALNRKEIATRAFYKQFAHASPLPFNHTRVQLNLEGDPELAQRLFEKGVRKLGIRKEDFPTLELIHSNLAFEKELADELKRQWKEILGINLITRELSWTDFSAALERGDFQMGGLFRRDLFCHPQYYLNFFQRSPMNPHSLDNPDYERLYQQIDSGEKNGEAIEKIETLLIEEAPVFPLICQNYFGMAQNYIKGFDWSTNGCINLDKVYFDEFTQANNSSMGV